MVTTQWPDALPRPGNKRFKRLDSLSPWFEVYQVNADTYALLEPRHDEEVISYLVLGDERAALIDSGMGIGNIRAEVERLTDLPLVVVNTHAHFDHVGDNHRFDEVWIFDDDWEVARLERGYSQADCAPFMGPSSYFDLPPDFDPTTYAIKPSSPTRRLRHLEAVDLGGRTLTVHHTPGHSPGSICLLDSRYDLLFTGDTFYPSTLIAHLEGSSFEAYQQSMAYLVELLDQVDHLCTSHNEIYAPKKMLVRVLAAFEQIMAGKITFELQGQTRVYRFEGFGVRLPLSSR
jgi:glyoxylase-like metal-dependent hydrolase (beta-lactamase superfamily II)